MAKKRPFFKETYNLKHRSEWIKLMENVPEKPKSVTVQRKSVTKLNKNVNQLWTWDTLEDVNINK